MQENNIDKSSLLDGNVSQIVTSQNQQTAEILAGQQKSSSRFYFDAKDDVEVNEVVRDVVPHVVTLIGFADVGKSTFVGSLYHHLMENGIIGDSYFYDSDTFAGFERRTYIRNAKLIPENRSMRTTELEGYFLSLYFENSNEQFELVLSDRSGETYGTNYIADKTKVQADKGLKNSKHLVFFIDSSVFINPQERLGFNNNFKKLLARLEEADIFKSNLTVDLVFNKIDIIEKASESDKKDFETRSVAFKNMLESRVKQSINKEFKISSNTVNDNEPLGEVFEYLVDCCKCLKQYNPKVDWVTDFLSNSYGK